MSLKRFHSWIYLINTSYPISLPSESFLFLFIGWLEVARADGRCDPDVQGLLSRMTYKDFLTTPEGRKVSRQLVTNLIEQQIGQEHGVSPLDESKTRGLMSRLIRLAKHCRGSAGRSVNLGMLSFIRSACARLFRGSADITGRGELASCGILARSYREGGVSRRVL